MALERLLLGALLLVELVDLPFGKEEGRPAVRGRGWVGIRTGSCVYKNTWHKEKLQPPFPTKIKHQEHACTHRSISRLSRNGERSAVGWEVGVGMVPPPLPLTLPSPTPGGLLGEGPRRAHARAMMVSPVVR